MLWALLSPLINEAVWYLEWIFATTEQTSVTISTYLNMAIYAYYQFRVNMKELFYISIVLSYIACIDILYYVMHWKCRSGKFFVFIFVGCFLVLPPLPLAKVHVIMVNLLSNPVIVLFSSLNKKFHIVILIVERYKHWFTNQDVRYCPQILSQISSIFKQIS